jgi:prephenate dehydrogenase
MKIIGIGLGLIGGSMLLSLKRFYNNATFLGVDRNELHLQKAIDLKIVDKSAKDEDFKTADLIIVSIPVDTSESVIKNILDIVNDKCLVIDMGSTKQSLCEALQEHPKRHRFLAAHPIAGTEFSGPEAAFESLFDEKTMILCEIEKTDPKLQNLALECFQKMQMNIRFMNPKAHDMHMAYVSHLSHISSFMLGKSVIDKEDDDRNIFDLAGSGFESTVRLAKSNPHTWVPIFKQNKTFVLEALSKYISNLELFRNQLESDDFENLFNTLKKTNQLKDILDGIK